MPKCVNKVSDMGPSVPSGAGKQDRCLSLAFAGLIVVHAQTAGRRFHFWALVCRESNTVIRCPDSRITKFQARRAVASCSKGFGDNGVGRLSHVVADFMRLSGIIAASR